MKLNKIKAGSYDRSFTIEKKSIDEENRTVEIAFSSEEPYERWYGFEILDHDKKSVDLSRLNNGGALLVDHNRNVQIGVVESARIDGDKVGRAVVRFGKSDRAQQEWQDVLDGIRRHISVGYSVDEIVLEKQEKDKPDTYRVTKWQPMEVSFVSIPADPTVGVGRQHEAEPPIDEKTVIDDKPEKEIRKMEPTLNPEPAPAAVPAAPAVDENAIREAAVAQEQSRVMEITEIGRQFGQSDMADQFIREGKPVDAFRKSVMEKIGAPKPVEVPDNASDIGLDQKEIQQFSVLRAIRALVAAREGKANPWQHAGFERAASDAVAQKMGKSPQGLYLPVEILQRKFVQRDLNVGTATAGGHTVATDLVSFIDLLRNKMVVMQMGAQLLSGLVGDIAIPRQTGGATAYWVAESGAPTESQQAFDQVTMSPETVGAYTDISRKLVLQSSIDVEAFVMNDLAKVIALEIDRVCINGSGSSNQPEGILNTTGIGSVVGGTNGAAPDWADVVDLETAVAQDNADIGALGYLTNTKVRGLFKKTEKATNTAQFVWENGENPLNGYRAGVSNQVPSNLTKGTASGVCSAIIFGNFSDLILGQWGGLDLMLDPYTGATSGTHRVVVHQDVDVAVRHAESFAAMKDALTA